ncbi:MAG: ATP-dependent helicase [Alphaproteobacteria bacterium]|nr:ATP-dependent helicase [Alphaproteobacteria bacterium]
MTLTKAQNDFINSKAKFIRLLAPAGCGKTFSIVEKTKKLLCDTPKAKIMIFTFTKNAAEEIRQRCGDSAGVHVFTLNSWGNSYVRNTVLKNSNMVTGDKAKWCVLNSLQPVWFNYRHRDKFEKLLTGKAKLRNSEKLLELIDEFKEIGFKHTEFTKDFKHNMSVYKLHQEFIQNVSLQRYYNAMVRSVLELISRKTLSKSEKEQHEYIVRHWVPFWAECCEHMFSTGQFTYADQKYFANIELEKKIKKNKKRNGVTKVDYIFVDEFQDTNPLDLMLVANLQKLTGAALIIVGDDDQAIFEFRGAAPYFILHPEQLFDSQFTTFILDENFRSPKNIVEKSMRLIKENKNRADKDVRSSSTTKEAEIVLYEYDSGEQMVDAVIADIKASLKESDKHVAVLSRKKSALLSYQILLTKEQIPYSVSDDLAFFYTAAANDLNTAIQIKEKNRFAAEDLAELVCMFSRNRFFSRARETLFRAFRANSVTMENLGRVMLMLGERQPIFENLFTQDYVTDFIVACNRFREAVSVYDTIEILLKDFGGFQQNYHRGLEELYYRDPPLSSLLNFAAKYESDFDSFVEHFNRAIARAESMADKEDGLLLEAEPQVLLSTALRVKGQEFNKVIILDAIDGIWPCTPTNNDMEPEEVESERRLFYVAVTRSKEHLHLYRTKQVGKNLFTQISPFVTEGQYAQVRKTFV